MPDAYARYVDADVDLAVTLDRATVAVSADQPADTLPPGPYRARRMRLWGVRIDARDGCMFGEVWFALDYEGDQIWVRAAECGPQADSA